MKALHLSALFGLLCVATAGPLPKHVKGCSRPGQGNSDEEGLPNVKTLQTGVLTLLSPGGNTICGDGSPFGFLVRRGDLSKVVIEFEGGFYCNDYASCTAAVPLGRQSLGLENQLDGTSDPPAEYADYLTHATMYNTELSTITWSYIYVPYCTQDFGIGNLTTEYTDGTNTWTQRYNGKANVLSVLDYLYDNFKHPSQVMVTACSAGGLTAAYASDLIATHYEDKTEVTNKAQNDDKTEATNKAQSSEHKEAKGRHHRFPHIPHSWHHSHPPAPAATQINVFVDSFTGVTGPLGAFLGTVVGASCLLHELFAPVYDISDPFFFQNTQTMSRVWGVLADKHPNAQWLLFAGVEDPYLYEGFSPSVFPGSPADLFQVDTREWVQSIVDSPRPNLKLWIEPSSSHCWFAGSFTLAIPGVAEWYNAAANGETIPSTICDSCGLEGGNGCSGTDQPYDVCNICGGDNTLCAGMIPLPSYTC